MSRSIGTSRGAEFSAELGLSAERVPVERVLEEIRLYVVSCPECPQGFAETA